MKKIFMLLAILMSASFLFNLSAQTVTAIKIKVDTIHKPAQCPEIVKITATISSTGTGTLAYKWDRSDGAIDNNNSTITLSGTGTDVVTTTWKLNRSYVGWERLIILSADRSRIIYTSNYGNFSLICSGDGGQGKGPRDTRARNN